MDMELDFTGEFCVPGASGEKTEAHHMARYGFAGRYAKDKVILDIACGVGYSAPLFVAAGATKYHGVDINEKLVEHARNKYTSNRASFRVGDICNFNSGEKYDLIVCFETIEHVSDYRSALSNLFSLLKSNGLLLISSVNRLVTSPGALSIDDTPANRFHIHEFTPHELVNELRAVGFTTDESDIFGQSYQKKHSNKFVFKLIKKLSGKPSAKSMAKITPMKGRTPRYFLISATKI